MRDIKLCVFVCKAHFIVVVFFVVVVVKNNSKKKIKQFQDHAMSELLIISYVI